MVNAATCLLVSSLLLLVGFRSASCNEQKCVNHMMPCQLKVYQMSTQGGGVTDLLTSDAVREDCRIAGEVVECLKAALATSDCQDSLTSEEEAQIHKGLNFVDYICVDRLVDVIRHRPCFIDAKLSEKCTITHDIITCEGEKAIMCAAGLLNQSNKCASTAKQFLNEVIRMSVSIIPSCQGLSLRFHQFFSEFF